MFEVIITHRVDAPDLIGALNNLAGALGQGRAAQPAAGPSAATPAVPVIAPAAAAAPVVPVTTPAAAAVAPVAAAPAITFDMIVAAGSQLLDAGRMNDLLTLLSQYGVQAITQLKPEQYESVAVALRGLGAKI